MIRRLAVLAGAAVMVATVGGAIPARATVGSGVISPWALQNENPNANYVAVPPAQAVLDAQHFNFITAHEIAYTNDIGQMKAANPSLKVLLYMNATLAQSYQPPTPPGTGGFDPSWYEKDANGNYVTNPTSGNFLMIPNNPGWIQSRIDHCKTLAIPAGYDGCYLDLLGLAPLAKGYLTAFPVNPATGVAWTQPDWLAATASLAKQVRDTVHGMLPPLLLYGNGLTDGPHFFNSAAPTKQIVDGIDGGVAEGWLRLAKQPVNAYPTATAWKQNVDMIGVIEAEGKPCLTLTKLWPATAATAAQQTAWKLYALASFLLGTQGSSAFFFSPSPTTLRTTTYTLYNTAEGTPSGPYAFSQGVYQRSFSNGLVMVNPSTTPVTVILTHPYYTLSRQKITKVTAGPNAGVILTST